MIVKSTLSAVNYVWIPVTKLKMQGHDDHEGDDDHDVVGASCVRCYHRDLAFYQIPQAILLSGLIT